MKLVDAYRFLGFCPSASAGGIFGDPKARVVRLVRRAKKHAVAPAGRCTAASTIARCGEFAISRAAIRGSSWRSRFDESVARAAAR